MNTIPPIFRPVSGVLLLLAALCIVLAPAAAVAQSALVTVEQAASTPPVRSDAPVTLIWKIRSESASLLEGQLEVVVYDGPEEVAHVIAEDVVLTAGEQLVRTVLPPFESNNPMKSVDLRVRFVGKSGKFGPWEFTIRMPDQWQRSFALLICDPWQTTIAADKRELADLLRPEGWNANTLDRSIVTIPAHVRPEDLPADPLGYCGFDVALIAHEAFSEMKEGQLRTLLEWVQAGGSACLAPPDGVLKDYHARFLNQAANAVEGQMPFLLDPAGRLMPRAAEGPTIILRRYGIGRIAILPAKLDRLLVDRENDVRQMLAFLWKLRQDRLAEFISTGKFLVTPPEKPTPEEQIQPYPYRNVSYAELRPKESPLASLPLQSGDQLLTRLMPQGLRVVPMGLIGLILFVYVILIGPTDWFVLGAIKRRKWTWITFPAVTVTLTLMTVWLAEWYMQVSDIRRTVTFYDVGEEGKIARSNRFEVLFRGSEAFVRTDLSREIFSALTLQRFSSAMWYNYQQTRMQRGDQSRQYTRVAKYSGRVPARYTAEQFAAQWTPQLNRRFSIPVGGPAAGEFDWSALADAAVYNPRSIL